MIVIVNHLQEILLFIALNIRALSSGVYQTPPSSRRLVFSVCAHQELWWCGGSQRSSELADRTSHHTIQQKEGDKPNGWIAASPRKHHRSEIQGWKVVCMCESACERVRACGCERKKMAEEKWSASVQSNTCIYWRYCYPDNSSRVGSNFCVY